MIGQKMLEFQLRRIGVFDAEESISSHPNFDENFKICEYLDNFRQLICLHCTSYTLYIFIWDSILLTDHHLWFYENVTCSGLCLCKPYGLSIFLVWANHGDDISIQYSGTPALKGDFVR